MPIIFLQIFKIPHIILAHFSLKKNFIGYFFVQWALALSLAAFLRPNIKLSNPGIVTNYLPVYWNIYNTLPAPSMTRKAQEEETAPAANSRRQLCPRITL